MNQANAQKAATAREAFHRRVAELGGVVLEPEYLGARAPHLCLCANGHECRPRPTTVQQGVGICRTCAGLDTTAARDAFYARVAELGGVVLEPEWLGAVKPHLVRCANGHECRPWPTTLQQGGGICRTCAGQDPVAAEANFRKRIAELGGTVLEPAWLGSQTPHRCRCIQGHECRPRPYSVQQGQGICQTCVGQDPAAAWENFKHRVAELGGVVLEPKWLGSNKPHRCRCSSGHECRPRPGHVQEGVGICRICAGLDPAVARENFIRRITELGGVMLEQRWLGNNKPHRCLCPEGHQCRPRPGHVQQGRGICLACAGQDSDVAWENFRRRVTELGGVVLEQEWLGSGKPHRCRCSSGHECRPTPVNIQRGQGLCRTCAWRDRDVLYVTRNPATGCVKFGITRRDGRVRLGVHRTDGYTEVIRLETGLPEGVAALAEQKIKVALAMAGAVPVRGTEYFSDEYLALIDNEIDNWVPLTLAV